MGSPWVGFFFRVDPPTILYILCLVSVLVSAFYFQVPGWMPYSPMGVQPLGFAPLQPFGVYLWQPHAWPGDGHQSTPGIHRVAAPSTTLSGEAFCYSVCCFPTIPSILWGIQPWGLGSESPDPSAFPTWWGGVFFSRFGAIRWHSWLWICDGHSTWWFQCDDRYQVDEFSHTWSAEQFVAHCHIYPGFTGKVS